MKNNEDEDKNVKITLELANRHIKELNVESAMISCDHSSFIAGKINPDDLLFNLCAMVHTVYTTINKTIEITPEFFMEKVIEGFCEIYSQPDSISTESHIYSKDPIAVNLRELLKQMRDNNETLQ